MNNQPFKLFKIALNVFPANISAAKRKMAVTLLQIGLHRIWSNRNTLKFEGTLPTFNENKHIILNQFTSLLKERFDFYSPGGLATFRQQFCHTPQLCTVHADDTLQVSLL